MRRMILLAAITAAITTSAAAQPIPVRSDPKGKYTALEIAPKPRGLVEILTRREGPSGISFALREINCDRQTFRYLGEGDTREKAAKGANRNQASNKLGQLTPGSISTEVAAFAGQFQGGAFDGSIDLKITMSHWLLPDGSTTIASNPGTVGSMGSIPAAREWMPHPQAKLVRFCADFVFCDRDISADLKARIDAYAARRLPQDMDSWSRERAVYSISAGAMVHNGALYVAKWA